MDKINQALDETYAKLYIDSIYHLMLRGKITAAKDWLYYLEKSS